MSRRLIRNIAILIAVGLVIGVIAGVFLEDVSSVAVGMIAGAVAVLLIVVIDRRASA